MRFLVKNSIFSMILPRNVELPVHVSWVAVSEVAPSTLSATTSTTSLSPQQKRSLMPNTATNQKSMMLSSAMVHVRFANQNQLFKVYSGLKNNPLIHV